MSEATVAQRDIPRIYSRIAPIYDVWAALTEARARRACLERAAVRDGESVLEVAVGTGLVFEQLVKANPSGLTEGVDLTEAMLDRARRKVSGLPGRHRLRVGDAHRLDAPDQTFDLVVNNYMFDLLPEADFPVVLGEFFRVTRPGGRLVLVNMARPTRALHRIWDVVYKINPAWLGGCRGVDLAPEVARAGFVNVERELLSQMGFPSEIIVARRPAAAA
ncbi:MAG: methyltransferase domain-containing protein [Deltaproteobacteria bacterium]|nr:methyltransferase domain-containing protein [Deltaproteobacteria bacterium]